MKKVILVKTDDPVRRQFNLVVTGPVEKVFDINPSSVYLHGKQGDTLKTAITITPSEKYKFSILGMEHKVNTKIKARLIELKKDKKAWQIKIECTSVKAEHLFDVLTLKTDSPYKPIVSIRVHVSFVEKQAAKS